MKGKMYGKNYKAMKRLECIGHIVTDLALVWSGYTDLKTSGNKRDVWRATSKEYCLENFYKLLMSKRNNTWILLTSHEKY